MITLWKQNGKGLLRTAILESNCWIHVTDPSELEIETLQREYGIQMDLIQDILDIDERSRSEKEENYYAIIFRVPIFDPQNEISYQTLPIGIILRPDVIITVCSKPNVMFDDITQSKLKDISLTDRPGFVLRLMLRSTMYYMRYLKDINRRTRNIENELQKSIRNNELIRLLNIEKSLVYFTTSLKTNELLLERLQKTFFREIDEPNSDVLEDVITENKQAIEMANIYSNILSGMMDAFASVISNNLNVVMKRLTSISLILMIPTLIASMYGMNIDLPFQNSPLAFLGIIAGSVGISLFGVLFFIRRRFF